MSYNDNDNDNSYGSSGRQGGDAGYGAGRSYGDDDVGRESGVNADGSYGSSRNEGLGDSSYGSSNRTGGGDSYGSSNTYGSSGRTGGDSYGVSDPLLQITEIYVELPR
ncbi:hypothetical protein CB0940_08705 [Cercospora beticola]|uniref:Stress protein DDR48 n=1 Tax=Cercospora beticola TaxID=122368 RepID=A0A2G5HQZ2_CERBT|nr:hypothetical protein CB0940_08705 [Cercospora beticola]PIA94961.1 hypothetical protein CB0940_08705 [Cercospora beticola]WPB05287.1 hypothetical protein RHO25_009939 [Cercospora beticola]CAK1365085.1 unnamed protein product [Cercospora beticola]